MLDSGVFGAGSCSSRAPVPAKLLVTLGRPESMAEGELEKDTRAVIVRKVCAALQDGWVLRDGQRTAVRLL